MGLLFFKGARQQTVLREAHITRKEAKLQLTELLLIQQTQLCSARWRLSDKAKKQVYTGGEKQAIDNIEEHASLVADIPTKAPLSSVPTPAKIHISEILDSLASSDLASKDGLDSLGSHSVHPASPKAAQQGGTCGNELIKISNTADSICSGKPLGSTVHVDSPTLDDATLVTVTSTCLRSATRRKMVSIAIRSVHAVTLESS